jgi:gliding motility-associated-like protein
MAAVFCCQLSSQAQICLGSLGDPIVNVTFGAGANPGPPLAAASTQYTYLSNDCPNDGFYAVRNSTINCFSPSWHSVVEDHTRDGRGYFMLVNASVQPGEFYADTVRGLCSNTNFEFAAWVANIIRPSACNGNSINPDLTFTIAKTDGTLLNTYNTGSIAPEPSANWNQYGFFFTTPPNVSDVVLRIFNNSRGGCGNDLALDDITFRPCGPSIKVAVTGQSSDTIFDCGSTASTFNFSASISAGFSNPFFQWQQSTDGSGWADISGANSTSFTVNFQAGTTPGRYQYRLAAVELANAASLNCRIVSKPLTVIKGTSPATTVNINSPVCEGQPVTFTATGGSKYLWTRENGGLVVDNNPFTIPEIDRVLAGKIYVKVTADGGCFRLDSANLVVLPKPEATVSFNTAGICNGNNIRLMASGGNGYKWTPALGLSAVDIPDPVAAPVTNTRYEVTVTSINNCTDTASVSIRVIEKVKADAGPDKTMLAGESVQLTAAPVPDAIYSWSPAAYLSDPGIQQPTATPGSNMDFILTVSSVAGCNTDIDTVRVLVFRDMYIPTAFSPNGDRFNDTWNIPALNAFPAFELAVYNRNGQLVYQCKQRFTPWDGYYKGQPLDAGIYVYLIHLNKPGREALKGTVMLLR